jgi:hypothetical protein
MAQRVVEILIGRLVTDEAFRSEFLGDPDVVLRDLRNRGLELSPTEIAALVATDRSVWTVAADRLDPRLQKSCLFDVSAAQRGIL